MTTEMTDRELLNQIPIEELSKLISEKTGYYIKFSASIGTIRRTGEEYLNIVSQDLKSVAGILSPLYRQLTLENFNSSFSKDKSEYWIAVHFAWEYVEGGSNGTALCNVYYNFADKTFTIK